MGIIRSEPLRPIQDVSGPRARSDSPPRAMRKPGAHQHDRTHVRVSMAHIAIVDDDPSLRVALGDLMRSMGYSVSLFESADDFLERADRSTFKGVIADVQMPGLNGFELARFLRTSRNPLPVILITARPDTHFDAEAAASGTVALLRKPFDSAALFAHVERNFV